MLEAKSLTKVYPDGHRALDGLDLHVARGEVFCLLGPNGAGKSTTVHLFLGFTKPTSGAAWVDRIDCTHDARRARQRIAYIPEQVSLYPKLTGLENLAYFHALSTGQRASSSRLREWLNEAGLDAHAMGRRVGEYSKGMKQKVGIAIAIAKNSNALLLDEPTSGLDPYAANEFSAMVRNLSLRCMAILMVTHDLFLAQQCGTRIGIMRQGKLMKTLSPSTTDHVGLESAYLETLRQ